MTDGKAAEDAVNLYLQSRGYRMIARNLRLTNGEIDWLGWDRDTLLVVEVKASKVNPELAAARIDLRKQNRLHRLTQEVLAMERYRTVTEFRILAIIAFYDTRKSEWEFFELGCMGAGSQSSE